MKALVELNGLLLNHSYELNDLDPSCSNILKNLNPGIDLRYGTLNINIPNRSDKFENSSKGRDLTEVCPTFRASNGTSKK